MSRPNDAAIRKAAILARLKQGPATMLELMALSPGGYRQRISDLRKDGHRIDCERIGHGSVFTLMPPTEAEQLSLLGGMVLA
jgi:hypothetical protein